jgi:hypothetical protein
MFAVADMDVSDDTVEILASEFFDKKISLYSIQKGPLPHVIFTRDIDTQCGAALGGILANLHPSNNMENDHDNSNNDDEIVSFHRVIDSGSTIDTLQSGDCFSHFLATSHECSYDVEPNHDMRSTGPPPQQQQQQQQHELQSTWKQPPMLKGGSLFAYRVPPGKDAWKTESWQKTTIATGFQVKSQIWNVINPGAPGFCYTFHAHKDDKTSKGKRPMIAVAGDCAESAYIFRPQLLDSDQSRNDTSRNVIDLAAQYKLMCEIKCGATVGSIAVGYQDLCGVEQESGYAKIYIPCFEKNKVLAFALGSGETDPLVDDYPDDDGW